MLTTPEIRQIGGRAGRYRISTQDGVTPPDPTKVRLNADLPQVAENPETSEPQKLGLVTSFEGSDLDTIRKCMVIDPEPIDRVGIFPTNDVIERFYSYFPLGMPYSFIIARILDISKTSSRYFFCDVNEILEIADLIQPIPNLSVTDRIKISFAPSIKGGGDLLYEMAQRVGEGTECKILELKHLNIDILDLPILPTREHLKELEELHKGLVLYNWMSFRFPGVFIERPLSQKIKMVAEEQIDKCLKMYSANRNIDKGRYTAEKAGLDTRAAEIKAKEFTDKLYGLDKLEGEDDAEDLALKKIAEVGLPYRTADEIEMVKARLQPEDRSHQDVTGLI